jgi:hypothetical protein
MKRTTIWIVIPVIFISGVIIGAYGGMKLTKHQVRGYAGRGPQMYLYRLINDLDLTEEQKKAIEASMTEAREKGEALNAEYFPQMQKIIEDSYAEILAQLTPEQKQTLETKREEMKKRWAKRRKRRRPRRSGRSTNHVHRSSRRRGGGTNNIHRGTKPPPPPPCPGEKTVQEEGMPPAESGEK